MIPNQTQKNLQNKLQNLLDQAVAQNDNAGCCILVLKNGEEFIYCQAGSADIEAGRKIERDSIYRIFSMSKPITAAAVMKLMEEGKISLLQPVSMYLPGFRNQKVIVDGQPVPVSHDVLIKELLDMTAGLVYPDDTSVTGKAVAQVYEKIEKGELSTLEAANALGACPLEFQPGTRWRYSTCADILGAIVEVVSGMKFSEFLKKEFFEPLGMKDTDFYIPEEKQNRRVKCYSYVDGQFKEEKQGLLGVDPVLLKRPAFEAGGAGLVSTVDDYGRFGAMLMNGGKWNGKQILSPRTVAYFTGGGLAPDLQKEFARSIINSPGYTYSNLLSVMADNRLAGIQISNGAYGWGGALGTMFHNSPEEKITIVYMMQTVQGGKFDVYFKSASMIMSELSLS